VILGQEHVPQAQLAGLDFQVLEDRRGGLPSLLAVAELGLEDGVRGDAVFLDELLDLLGLVSSYSIAR
jgi:hypothetical protein